MTLKNSWANGQKYQATDQNAVASQVNQNTSDIATKQPQAADLTQVASLTPANDDVLQRKGGVWTSRTPAQLKTDLAIGTGDISGLSGALGNKQDTIGRNAANGYAGLDGSGKLSASQLPGVQKPVEEYTNLAAFPGTGETSKVYIAADTGYSYRWTGTAYSLLSVPSTVRTGVFPFEMCNSSGTWASQPLHDRREFSISQKVRRFRVHFRNRNQLADTQGNPVTGMVAYVGIPSTTGSADGKWNGQCTTTPTQILTSTNMAANAEVVTPWVSPSTFTIDPYKRYVLSYGFTTPASGVTCFGGGVVYQTALASDAGLANPSGMTRITNAAFLQVWIEYEFANDNAPVMLVVSNSLSNGTNNSGGAVDNNGEIGSWPQVWAMANGGVAASIGVASSLAANYKAASAGARWDVYDPCASALDPDVVLYYALASSDVIGEGGSTITTSQADFLGAIAKGKSKFPNARHIITNIPPRGEYTGSGATAGTLEKARLDFNRWSHLLPAGVETCFDVDALVSNWADPARMRAGVYDVGSGDATHLNARGHHTVGNAMPAFGRRAR
ncbi:hypothetical protein FZI85_17175 [Mycobacterium sp. CBMA293]|uniref:hypothetical protein n=1 Tax=unclassified Mycolicibacterium TaxID=2636767 RepID=UPI0012DCFD23|nr:MULTISPECIES: hypothetical protein [unclassified Mycolicibacterium]MUL44456.1 hypothetical protein [Mycolicibacterium sp. CBMA 360]MUL59776.1 hypothetical protein [Mycolicibacterium sp. CBMA 335]MUL68619.1 hypothetical protein [Mycolicibacterium sp. CBMA 311]MUL93990.1 hypothetical protein [Mycolicibacterium sp. CBMA 230]MUM06237.1 hypothetical protein [Mycolicibacterium sp. CBMA 213]